MEEKTCYFLLVVPLKTIHLCKSVQSKVPSFVTDFSMNFIAQIVHVFMIFVYNEMFLSLR